MFRDVAIFSVPVSDQERAKRFYVETLGFELVRDNPMGPDQRWVEVRPPGAETSLTLVTWFATMPPEGDGAGAERASAQQDLWHYSIGRMVDACAATGTLPFYGPFGDIADVTGCEAQFRAAFLMGCVGAWTLHPRQIEVARRVFSPDPEEVHFAKKVIEAIPDGRGVT